MKTAKKVLLFIMGLMIVSMIILLSCKNRYTGPGDKGIFEEGSSGETGENGGGDIGSGLPAGYLTQDEQYEPMGPDSKKMVLFTGDNYRIPALTITANKMILAAVGTGTGQNHIAIKRSEDLGQTWTDIQANYEGFSGMYTHPFFINCHDGSVLLGIATTNSAENKTTIYKSVNDGGSWTKLTEINSSEITNNLANGFVSYGQGIALRHGNNGNKLLFPYFYTNTIGGKDSRWTATLCSTSGGKEFTQLGSPYGPFQTYETKFIELANGDVLLNMRSTSGQTYWMKSTNCGDTWEITTKLSQENGDGVNSGKHADLTRYEFNGRDIKVGGEKYALMVISKKNGTGYNVRMTFNDFGNGAGNFNNKYLYNKDFATNNVGGDGYPAITVLPDGTIATLTEETDGIVFRRFNLSWLSSVDGTEGGEDYVDYELDNITK